MFVQLSDSTREKGTDGTKSSDFERPTVRPTVSRSVVGVAGRRWKRFRVGDHPLKGNHSQEISFSATQPMHSIITLGRGKRPRFGPFPISQTTSRAGGLENLLILETDP